MYKDVACSTIKIKVEYMQFMSVGSKSIIGSMLTTEFPGYGPLEIFCIQPFQLVRCVLLSALKYSACQRRSRYVSLESF